MADKSEILIVEDNPYDEAMILDAFSEQEDLPGKVRVLRDGREALDHFFGSDGSVPRADIRYPGFVLLDLKLPKIDGLEVLKRLKDNKQTRDIPVIVFTSSNEARDRKESYRLGANSYIVKPLDADCFSRYVIAIASYWLTLNRTRY